jgi:hypothetical protein
MDEPPAHGDQLSGAVGSWPNNFHRVRRGNVVMGCRIPRRTVRKVIQVLDVVPGVALNEASAHCINPSIFGSESVPPRACDPNADNLYRSVASLHVLSPCHRKSAADETGDHVAIEPKEEHKQFLGGALRIAGKQLQRPALL